MFIDKDCDVEFLFSFSFLSFLAGKCVSIATASLWLSNFAIAYGTPSLLSALGVGGAFFLMAFFNAASFFFVLFLLPETKVRISALLIGWFGCCEDKSLVTRARTKFKELHMMPWQNLKQENISFLVFSVAFKESSEGWLRRWVRRNLWILPPWSSAKRERERERGGGGEKARGREK